MIRLLFMPLIYLSVIINNFLVHCNIFAYGDGRIVFLFKKHAVKIPLNIRGLEQSKQEIKMWNKYHHVEMCPILFNLWTIIIMPRCEIVKEKDINQDYNPFHSLEEYNYESQMDNDFANYQNWGKLNGKFVVVDYGLTKYVNKKYYTTK